MADPEWKKLPVVEPVAEPEWKKLPVVQSAPTTPLAPERTVAESGLQGFGQGASFGFADELAGVVQEGTKRQATNAVDLMKSAAGRAVLRRFAPSLQHVSDAQIDAMIDEASDEGAEIALGAVPRSRGGGGLPGSGYTAGRNEARREAKASEEANPRAFLAGNVAGAVASPGPKGLGATRLMAQGGAYGTLAGVGMSEADLASGELAPALGDAVIGAGTGAILTPVASGLSARMGRFLKGKAQENALKAVGARAGISDVLGSQGIKTADDARQLGQVAIDKGLVEPFSTAADVAQNTGFALEREGARVGAVLSDADAAAAKSSSVIQARNAAKAAEGPFWWRTPEPAPPPFDFNAAAWRAAGEVMGPDGLTTEAVAKVGPAAKTVQRILAQGERDPTFAAANRLKSDIYDGINYGVDPALTTRLQQSAARGLKKSIEDQVEGHLGVEAADELRAANRSFGELKTIQSLASEAARRQMGQAGALSPGVVAASFASGSPAPMVMRAASPYIPSTVSWLQRTASPAMFPLGQAATRPATQGLAEEEQNSVRAFLRGG